MTTTVKIVGAGVEMEIDPELVNAKDNYTTLRRALSSVSEGIANAKIVELTHGEDITVEVTPKMGSKGLDPNGYLREIAERRNPAIAMYLSLEKRHVAMGSHEMYNMGLQATGALKEGNDWIEQIAAAESILIKCQPTKATLVLPG